MSIVKQHDCAHRGHVWIEASGQPFVRHRGRSGKVNVHCEFCPATATLDSHGANTAPPQKIPPSSGPAREP